MNIKQKKFADNYIKTGNAYHSAIDAGYSKNYASGNVIKLLEKDSVKTYIEGQMHDLEKETIADADEVLQYLTSVMRGEVTEPTLKGTGKGNQILIDTKPQVNDRTRAAELIGRRYAVFTDKLEIDGNVGVNIIDDIPEDVIDD